MPLRVTTGRPSNSKANVTFITKKDARVCVISSEVCVEMTTSVRFQFKGKTALVTGGAQGNYVNTSCLR